MNAPQMLVRYDAMCTAIAECHRVDEVKEIRDKARALEVYAKQAKNTDAERKAADIRLRAERRAGELLSELARATPQTANPSGVSREPMSNDATRVEQSDYSRALEETGISRQTAHRFQQLAAVPQATFEQALADPIQHPSAARILREARDVEAQSVQQIDRDALRVWGVAREFERQRDLSRDCAALFSLMTETMQADIRRIAPQLARFWAEFTEAAQ